MTKPQEGGLGVMVGMPTLLLQYHKEETNALKNCSNILEERFLIAIALGLKPTTPVSSIVSVKFFRRYLIWFNRTRNNPSAWWPKTIYSFLTNQHFY